jgi:hypothetical protein
VLSSVRPVRGATRVTAALAAALLLGLLLPGAATSEREIAIHGPDSSSHLRISYSAGAIHVQGYLPAGGQSGCQGHGGSLECPTDGAGGLEIVMGPQDDKVEIHGRLPFGVTVRLGDGSDKFLGGDEPDTCYSEGAKRNRCYGFGGDDVCITGDQNSDCVGGDGNDYCRHGDGSDGCWGGPGDDECVMNAGQDGCHGGPGDDRLFGGPGADQLYGGKGHDFCDGGPGVGRSHTCEAGPGG